MGCVNVMQITYWVASVKFFTECRCACSRATRGTKKTPGFGRGPVAGSVCRGWGGSTAWGNLNVGTGTRGFKPSERGRCQALRLAFRIVWRFAARQVQLQTCVSEQSSTAHCSTVTGPITGKAWFFSITVTLRSDDRPALSCGDTAAKAVAAVAAMAAAMRSWRIMLVTPNSRCWGHIIGAMWNPD